jgi:hypothetical protein
MLLKEEKFTTDFGNESFTLSIGELTKRLLFSTEQDTLQFTKEEVAELIYILQKYYERLD